MDELDRHGVRRIVLFSSVPDDEESVAAASRAWSDRLVGYAMIDPTQGDPGARARRAFGELGLRGVTLFPAMHRFHAWEERVYPIYQAAVAHRAVVFVHFGLLKVGIRDKVGVPGRFDLRFSNPIDLSGPAADFPDTPFVIPHFGCGFFREALLVGDQRANVYLDTSSSNTWVTLLPHPLTLRDLFERALAVLGASRVLFGTDSNYFPRGWRHDIFDSQRRALEELGRSEDEVRAIFGGNLERLLGLGPERAA